MKVEKDDPSTDFIGDKVKFIERHFSCSPPVLRTEITVKVAYICYLYIAAINQFMYKFTIYNLLFGCKDTKNKSFSRICLVYSFSFANFANNNNNTK